MDRGAWWAVVHGGAKSRTRLNDFTFAFHFHALEKEMATHSSVLAWRIPGTGEPGGLPSMGSHRVGHDWSDFAAAAASILVKIYFYINPLFYSFFPTTLFILLYVHNIKTCKQKLTYVIIKDMKKSFCFHTLNKTTQIFCCSMKMTFGWLTY